MPNPLPPAARTFLATLLDDDQMAKLNELLADAAGSGTAMDGASPMAALQALRIAEDAVRPYVGAVPPLRSADEVYRHALGEMGHNVRGVPPGQCEGVWRMLRGARSPAAKKADLAQDRAFAERFPDAGRLKHCA